MSAKEGSKTAKVPKEATESEDDKTMFYNAFATAYVDTKSPITNSIYDWARKHEDYFKPQYSKKDGYWLELNDKGVGALKKMGLFPSAGTPQKGKEEGNLYEGETLENVATDIANRRQTIQKNFTRSVADCKRYVDVNLEFGIKFDKRTLEIAKGIYEKEAEHPTDKNTLEAFKKTLDLLDVSEKQEQKEELHSEQTKILKQGKKHSDPVPEATATPAKFKSMVGPEANASESATPEAEGTTGIIKSGLGIIGKAVAKTVEMLSPRKEQQAKQKETRRRILSTKGSSRDTISKKYASEINRALDDDDKEQFVKLMEKINEINNAVKGKSKKENYTELYDDLKKSKKHVKETVFNRMFSDILKHPSAEIKEEIGKHLEIMGVEKDEIGNLLNDLGEAIEETAPLETLKPQEVEKLEHDLKENIVDKEHLKTGENKKPLPIKHLDIDLKHHLARFHVPTFRPGTTRVDVKHKKLNTAELKRLTI